MTDRVSSRLVPPHGGRLVSLLLQGAPLKEAKAKAASLPVIRMTSRETSDLIMLGTGAFSPLEGFMSRSDYVGVVREMRTASGILWPIPITLSVPRDTSVRPGDEVALVDDKSGELMGSMHVEEMYAYNKLEEVRNVFRATDANHPGVAKVMAQGDILLGGPVKVFSELDYPERFPAYYARPMETRAIFEERGWKTVAAFQTRNPMHRSHEYCIKIAGEVMDGVLIHALVGKLKEGDIPADVRMRCYEVLLENYYPAERIVCKVYPMEMRYGGPREAVLHAIIRQNFGCTHLIVGRDHAGVGNYYGPFDAQDIFDDIDPSDLAIRPLKIDWVFWCNSCEGMASTRTCPHDASKHVQVSGTEARRMLGAGETPPAEFMRPEVAEILIEYYKSL